MISYTKPTNNASVKTDTIQCILLHHLLFLNHNSLFYCTKETGVIVTTFNRDLRIPIAA